MWCPKNQPNRSHAAKEDIELKNDLMRLSASALIFILCFFVSNATEIKDISSWTYEGMTKTTQGADVKTEKTKKVIDKWSDIKDADMVKFPMKKGQEWGHEGGPERTDHKYCYFVKDIKMKELSHIKGVGKGKTKVYTIRYETLGGCEEADYAEGIGIIRYEFVHHGTVDEEYWRLAEVVNK